MVRAVRLRHVVYVACGIALTGVGLVGLHRGYDRLRFRRLRAAESDLRTVSIALECFMLEHRGLTPEVASLQVVGPATEPAYCWPPPAWPVKGRVANLRPSLVPAYVRNLPVTDPWGHPYLAALSSDRKHYTLMFTGSDGKVDAEFPAASHSVLTFGSPWYPHDIVMANDRFVLLPEGESP
jgi:hypothetical protein